jgi:hypothetical protein
VLESIEGSEDKDKTGGAVERLVVEQQRAEQRLLRFHRVRRKPEGYDLRIGNFGTGRRLYRGHLFCFPPGAHRRQTRSATEK